MTPDDLTKREADDPFAEARAIRRGECDDQLPMFDVITGWIQRAPLTWQMGLLIRCVKQCVVKQVFKDDAAMLTVVQRAIEHAHDPNSMLRKDDE